MQPNYQRKGLVLSMLINQTRKDAEDKHWVCFSTPNKQSLPDYEKKANFKIINNINVYSIPYWSIVMDYIKKSQWILG